jgi:hypothetical protein
LTCGTLDQGNLLESFSWNLIASVIEMAISRQLTRQGWAGELFSDESTLNLRYVN